MGLFDKIIGSVNDYFHIGKDGPRLARNGNNLESRSNDGSILVPFRVGDAVGDDDAIKKSDSVLIFGTEYQYAASDRLSSTTSWLYVQKLRMTTPSLPIGTYRLGVTYSWTIDGGGNFISRVQKNNSLTVFQHIEDPALNDREQILKWSSFIQLPLSGINTFDLDYATEEQGPRAYISEARMELWRVS